MTALLRLTLIFLFAVGILFSQAHAQLRISEFLFRPNTSSGPGEWVEIYNTSGQPFPLDSLCLEDGDGNSAMIVDSRQTLAHGEYAILCQSLDNFNAFYQNPAGQLLAQTSWPALNNSGDCLILRSANKTTLDSVCYSESVCNQYNVSVERLSLSAAPADVSNWGCSVDMVGATPGLKNSMDRPYQNGFEFNIPIKTFSPDGDQYRDILEMYYAGPAGAALTIRIFDARGEEVRTLCLNTPGLPGKPYTWDVCDMNGRKLSMGIYLVWVEQRYRGKCEHKKFGVIIARRFG